MGKKAPGDLIETCRINEALPGVLGNKGHLYQMNKGTKTEWNKGNFGELRFWFGGRRENAYFPGVQGDEALPCVGGCGARGGGVPVPLFPKIFLDFPFSPDSKY